MVIRYHQFVHGDIRHLEIVQVDCHRLYCVHGDIRHLEIH